jgi:hypothetical protein
MMGGQQVDAMANPEHLAKLEEGAKAWNRWRRERLEVVSPDLRGAKLNDNKDLRGVNLSHADLLGADLSHANLNGADLRRAILNDAELHVASLSEADLSRAMLSRASLSQANVTGANLSGANLVEVNFRWADLSGANLEGANLVHANLFGVSLTQSILDKAIMGFTILANMDLRTIKGLDRVIHISPSSVSTDTIYRSKGQISEIFLRGCGVPDEFITFAKSLVTSAIEFYSCFISYSTKDQAFADRLYADLQNKGVRCWFAPHDVQGAGNSTSRSTKPSACMTSCC